MVDVDWVTVEEAAHKVEVDVDTVREWCRSGQVASYRDGPYHRMVRLEEARSQAYLIKGRPRTSLHALIAEATGGGRGHASLAGVSQLQTIARERALAR
jgi:excisionase family DNA binding protein